MDVAGRSLCRAISWLEVSRLAGRIGIIHNGHLLQELSTDEVGRKIERWRLLVRTRDVEAAYRALSLPISLPKLLKDGSIEIKTTASVARPDEINQMLVNAGVVPT